MPAPSSTPSLPVEPRPSAWRQYRFSLVLLFSILTGSVIGLIFKEKTAVLRPLGDIFLNLMFTVVVPVVFVTVSSAVGNMLNMRRLGNIVGSMFGVFFATGAIAAAIILVAVTVFPPALGAPPALSTQMTLGTGEAIKTLSLSDTAVQALTVSDFPELFSRRNMLPLIVFSIFFGFCVSRVGGPQSRIGQWLDELTPIVMKMVDIIMLYAPIGLGAYFAALVGEFGPGLLASYGRALAIYLPVCLLYFIVAFPLYAWLAGGRPAVTRLARHIWQPAITSLATQSSIATLPVNLEAAERIGVPKDIRDIVLPIGATVHMEGSVFAAMLKIAFLFGLFETNFDGPMFYLTAFLVSIMAGVVMSGVPGGGLIGEMLIINLFGFPPGAFPIIATIGFLVDAPATCINATGDTVSAMLVARIVEGKDWLRKASGETLPTTQNQLS